MSLRIPQSLAGMGRMENGATALDAEIAQQKASTLGGLGRQVEQALARLGSLDASGAATRSQREALLDEAADRVWTLMVQRELCGLRHWDAVVKAYGVPREVLNRMGRAKG